MTFEKRLARIGKGTCANLYLNNDSKISIFLCNNSVQEKVLDISSEKYNLKSAENVFGYDEVIRLDNNVFVVRLNKNVSAINYE